MYGLERLSNVLSLFPGARVELNLQPPPASWTSAGRFLRKLILGTQLVIHLLSEVPRLKWLVSACPVLGS